jgi:hypothetical protein
VWPLALSRRCTAAQQAPAGAFRVKADLLCPTPGGSLESLCMHASLAAVRRTPMGLGSPSTHLPRKCRGAAARHRACRPVRLPSCAGRIAQQLHGTPMKPSFLEIEAQRNQSKPGPAGGAVSGWWRWLPRRRGPDFSTHNRCIPIALPEPNHIHRLRARFAAPLQPFHLLARPITSRRQRRSVHVTHRQRGQSKKQE